MLIRVKPNVEPRAKAICILPASYAFLPQDAARPRAYQELWKAVVLFQVTRHLKYEEWVREVLGRRKPHIFYLLAGDRGIVRFGSTS